MRFLKHEIHSTGSIKALPYLKAHQCFPGLTISTMSIVEMGDDKVYMTSFDTSINVASSDMTVANIAGTLKRAVKEYTHLQIMFFDEMMNWLAYLETKLVPERLNSLTLAYFILKLVQFK